MSEKPLKEKFSKFKGLEIFEEKSKKFLKKVGESLELFFSDVFDTAIYTLFPKLKNSETITNIDSTKQPLGIFWDYDNFAIPKDGDLEFFFDQIIPDETVYQILSKKVFSLEENIEKRRKLLEKKNFEIKTVPYTGKKNETDLELFTQCIDFCSGIHEPTLILLISGDRDYVSLVRKIIERGNDVSLICTDKKQIHPELRKRVPNIVDRKDLFNPKNYLKYDLKFVSDTEEWKNKWNKLKKHYPNEKDQYRLLRNIYHRNENLKIRNLILQELEKLA